MAIVGAFRIDPSADRGRDAARHHLQLSAEIVAGGSEAKVLIHNLSATGLLIETSLDLDVGDEFEVELPRSASALAQIVWRGDSYFGCQFAEPLPEAVVSAARLRSPPADRRQDAGSMFEAGEHAPAAAASTGLSPLRKAIVIGSLAIACWIPVVAAILYFSARR